MFLCLFTFSPLYNSMLIILFLSFLPPLLFEMFLCLFPSFFFFMYLPFFFQWANAGLFFVYFWSFQTNITIFATNQCEKCPSSIQCQDSNPQPLKHELSPITTRPGLPPNIFNSLMYRTHNLCKTRHLHCSNFVC